MSVYRFPKLFVEGKGSDEYLELDREKGEARLVTRSQTSKLGKVPSEIDLNDLIDLVGERVKRSFAVYNPQKGIAIYVKEGAPVKVLRVAHKRVRIELSEGDEIYVNDTYAHGLTSKGEYRRFRSKVNGIVALVHWEPKGGEDIYHLIVVDKNFIEKFKVDEEKRGAAGGT